MKDVKSTIAANLTMLRKSQGLTQAELAEKFNYTDKAICRWEHGDTLPDINTLYALCEFYGITLNDLTDPECKPDSVERHNKDEFAYGILVCILLGAFVWFIATLGYIYALTLLDLNYWLAFVWALPISCAVIARSGKKIIHPVLRIVLFSVMLWTALTAVFLHMLLFLDANMWMLFIAGVPLEAVIIIWQKMKKYRNQV